MLEIPTNDETLVYEIGHRFCADVTTSLKGSPIAWCVANHIHEPPFTTGRHLVPRVWNMSHFLCARDHFQ